VERLKMAGNGLQDHNAGWQIGSNFPKIWVRILSELGHFDAELLMSEIIQSIFAERICLNFFQGFFNGIFYL